MELRKIALNFQVLSSTTIVKLKKAAILIGSRCVQRQESEDPLGDEEEGWYLEHDILTPNGVAIVDDMITFQHFGEVVFCAPQEDTLEGEHSSICP